MGGFQLRVQPPVVSPITLTGIWSAARAGIATGDDASERLTTALKEQFDADAAVLTDSGTSALVLALRLTTNHGAIVALPGYGCIDISAAAELRGVRARLYDVEPGTLSPDLDSLRRALVRGVDAIVVAHLFGYASDVPAAMALAEEFGVPVIEDAAQGAYGTLREVRLGSFGGHSVLSFGRGKGITGGGGGALLLRGDSAVHRAAALTETLAPLTVREGWQRLAVTGAQWALGRPSLYSIPSAIPGLRLGEMVYHPAKEPARIAKQSAALALESLRGAPTAARTRSERASMLTHAAADMSTVRMVNPLEGSAPGYLRFPLLVRGGRAAPSLGVIAGYPATLAQHAPLGPLLLPGEQAGPGSEELRDTLFTLPTHQFIGARDIERLARWMQQ